MNYDSSRVGYSIASVSINSQSYPFWLSLVGIVAVTDSGRPIFYVGLAPLTREQYEPIFAATPLYKSSDVVCSFVADVNGHPRTLFSLRDMLQSQKYSAQGFKPARSDLLDDLRVQLDIQQADFHVPAQVVVNALMQQPVCSNDPTEPDGLPYSYYIAMVCHSTHLYNYSQLVRTLEVSSSPC